MPCPQRELSSALVGLVVIEERGGVLAVLCDGGCAPTSGDGGRYFTKPSLNQVEPDNVLAEKERI